MGLGSLSLFGCRAFIYGIAAVTLISTRIPGRAIWASTQALTPFFCGEQRREEVGCDACGRLFPSLNSSRPLVSHLALWSDPFIPNFIHGRKVRRNVLDPNHCLDDMVFTRPSLLEEFLYLCKGLPCLLFRIAGFELIDYPDLAGEIDGTAMNYSTSSSHIGKSKVPPFWRRGRSTKEESKGEGKDAASNKTGRFIGIHLGSGVLGCWRFGIWVE